MRQELIDKFKAIVGPEHLLAKFEDCACYAYDASAISVTSADSFWKFDTTSSIV